MLEKLSYSSRKALCCLLLFASTFLLFLPSLQNDFLNYDDDHYITESELVKAGPTLRALYEPHFFMWHPVTTLSLQLDYLLHGMNAAGFRLGNILVHSASAVLVLLFCWRVIPGLLPGILVAALFAWHPMRVESVIWAAERKDVLCTFFWLLTVLSYLWWDAKRTKERYLVTLGAAALAMMSKPMAMTLPVTLLLLDFWPLKRFSMAAESDWRKDLHRLTREKVPFFFMAILLALITLNYQAQSKAMVSLDEVSMLERLANTVTAYGGYVWKTLFPYELAVFYPMEEHVRWGRVFAALAGLSLLGRLAWVRRESQPQLLWGLGWFLVILLPVIGLLQTGRQAMADRYSYMAMLGLLIAAAHMVFHPEKREAASRVRFGVVGVLALACAWLTYNQIPRWKNSETLFRHALAVTSNNYVAHANLAAVLANSGRLEEALEHYEAALRIRPSASLHYKLGSALLARGRAELARKHLEAAIKIDPSHARAHFELAMALTDLERFDESLLHLKQALDLEPMLERHLQIPPGHGSPSNAIPDRP